MIKASRRGQASDLITTTFPTPLPRQRFLEIVNAEVNSSAIAEETGVGKNEIVVEVPIPKAAYAKLKLLVNDYKAGGKKVSISDFVARLVLAHLNKHTH